MFAQHARQYSVEIPAIEAHHLAVLTLLAYLSGEKHSMGNIGKNSIFLRPQPSCVEIEGVEYEMATIHRTGVAHVTTANLSQPIAVNSLPNGAIALEASRKLRKRLSHTDAEQMKRRRRDCLQPVDARARAV